MFEAVAISIIATTLFGVVVDDELYRFLNTVANMATVALLVWHQRRVRRKIEPQVEDTAAVVKRELGTRIPEDTEEYRGPDRRKTK